MVVVFRFVCFVCFVDKWVYSHTYTLDIYIIDIQKIVLGHQWFRMCLWRAIHYNSDYFLLHFQEWLEIVFVLLGRAPDGDGVDQMGEDEGVVELDHRFAREELAIGGVAERSDMWL